MCVLVSIVVVRVRVRVGGGGCKGGVAGVARLLSALTLELLGQQHPHRREPTPAVTAAAPSAAYQPVEAPTAVSLNG